MKIEILRAPDSASAAPPRDAAGRARDSDRERALRLPSAAGSRALDSGVAQRWRDHLARVGAGDAVTRNLERLARGAACVVTGQQAGLLGGPLYTMLKAARAVSLARELEDRSGWPVVPIFWVAADDHDLDEIHSTFVPNEQGEIQRVHLELGGARGAAGEVAAPADAARAVHELWKIAGIDENALPSQRFLPLAQDSLATWFARVLLELFGAHGLVPFEPALFGAAARPIYEGALRDDGAIARALREGAEALRARGEVAPLPIEEDPPVFLIEPGRRTRVHRDARGLFLAESARRTTRDELLAHSSHGVPRLSANVALRPILQAALLPALAYVAGPNEALYYEQLAPLHRLFDVPFPSLEPRPQATVLDTHAARALRKLGLAPRELFERLEARRAAAAGVADTNPASAPPAVTPLERGAQLRAEVQRWLDELFAARPAVRAAAERRANQLLQSFDGVLERARSAFAEGDATAARRLDLLEHLVHPRGKPQDRSLNVLPFLAQHGPALIESFLELRGGADVHALVFAQEAPEMRHG